MHPNLPHSNHNVQVVVAVVRTLVPKLLIIL
jgi:hypothetical protein